MEDNAREEEWGTKRVIHRRSAVKRGCGIELTAVPHSGDAYKWHLWTIPGEGREKAETIYPSALDIIVPHAYRSCMQGLGTGQNPVLLSVWQTWDGKLEIHGWGGRCGIIWLHLVNLLRTPGELEQGCQEDLRRRVIGIWYKRSSFPSTNICHLNIPSWMWDFVSTLSALQRTSFLLDLFPRWMWLMGFPLTKTDAWRTL